MIHEGGCCTGESTTSRVDTDLPVRDFADVGAALPPHSHLFAVYLAGY